MVIPWCEDEFVSACVLRELDGDGDELSGGANIEQAHRVSQEGASLGRVVDGGHQLGQLGVGHHVQVTSLEGQEAGEKVRR